MDYTRRDFLNTITSATLSAAGLSVGASFLSRPNTDYNHQNDGYSAISDGDIILFQGDSITDSGRDKQKEAPNVGLGSGYVLFASANLRHNLADRNLKCYNRGISGNKVYQLSDRWREDCLQLEPDLLSILIGVNDFWHTLNGGYNGTVEIYKRDYIDLLKRTKDHLPDSEIVIGEPFIIKEGSAVSDEWLPDFYDYQTAAKEVAKMFDAAFIPYQSVFDKATQQVSPTYWSGDGVHPTMAGYQLMAQSWLETVKRI